MHLGFVLRRESEPPRMIYLEALRLFMPVIYRCNASIQLRYHNDARGFCMHLLDWESESSAYIPTDVVWSCWADKAIHFALGIFQIILSPIKILIKKTHLHIHET